MKAGTRLSIDFVCSDRLKSMTKSLLSLMRWRTLCGPEYGGANAFRIWPILTKTCVQVRRCLEMNGRCLAWLDACAGWMAKWARSCLRKAGASAGRLSVTKKSPGSWIGDPKRSSAGEAPLSCLRAVRSPRSTDGSSFGCTLGLPLVFCASVQPSHWRQDETALCGSCGPRF